jgi:hypothetical protein
VLWVVLDPASADAVLTDSLDRAFWKWLERTYPQSGSAGTERGAKADHDEPPAGAPNGTIFLVDPRQRVVLWSTYAPAKNTSAAQIDHTASRIANELKAAFGKK